MPSYFVGFDLLKINSYGLTYKVPNQAVQVFNVTGNAALPATASDEFGVVAGGQLNVAPGTLVRFSVAGYTPVIERTTTAAENLFGVAELSLLLEDTFTEVAQEPEYNEVYIRTDQNSDPVRVGTVQSGGTLTIPFNPAQDSAIKIYSIARGADGTAHTFDLMNAAATVVTPNREVSVPTFSQDGAALNARINFRAANFTSLARLRRIQWASNNTFTANLRQKVEGNALSTTVLPAEFFIDRDTNLANAETVYVRIAHSSGSSLFGTWSDIRTASFTDAGGGGGSGGSYPPSDLSGYGNGPDVNLYWTNNGGGSLNQIYRNGVSIGSVSASSASFNDYLIFEGYYEYQVTNDDGSTNTWGYQYFNGGF
jgi:hypothetical protein